MGTDLLRIEHLTKNFGGIYAVNDLNMLVGKGEIVAVIGPNGSGKTTLFNLIVHLYDTTGGKIYFGDPPVDIARIATHAINALGVARTFQTLRLFPNLTVVENVLVGMSARLPGGPLNAVFQTRRTRQKEAEAEAEALELLSLFGHRLISMYNEPASTVVLCQPASPRDRSRTGFAANIATSGRTCRRYESNRNSRDHERHRRYS